MAHTCREQRKILNSPFTLVTLEYIKRKKCVLVTNYPSLPYRGQLHIWLLASGVEKEWLGWTSDAGSGSCYIRRWSLCQNRSLWLAIAFFFLFLFFFFHLFAGGGGRIFGSRKEGSDGKRLLTRTLCSFPSSTCKHSRLFRSKPKRKMEILQWAGKPSPNPIFPSNEIKAWLLICSCF